jgi:imidazoleglycerol-phosphate dehydratase
MSVSRKASVKRKTGETSVSVSICLDGKGEYSIDTGIPFFDHMLSLFAKHGRLDLRVKAGGDLEVDSHHTVEDTGIALGQAVLKALGDKKGIRRYGFAFVPMDEALVRVVIDISGRPFTVYDVKFPCRKREEFNTGLVEEFMRAFSVEAKAALHVKLLYGKDGHHIAEAAFKAMGVALGDSLKADGKLDIPSTKGSL